MALTFGTTPNFLLRWLRGGNNASDIDDGFRSLAEDIDSKMLGLVVDTFAKKPAAGIVNRLFKASDTGAIYLDSGTEWQQLVVGNGLFSNAGSAKRPLELREFQSSPTAGNTSAFGYTETGIAFPTACVSAWIGGFLCFADAGHANPQPYALNAYAAPHGKNVEVIFQQPIAPSIYPLIKVIALGY